MSEFKLFVVGEFSPNPDEWMGHGASRALVIARNPEEAVGVADSLVSGPATEISLDRSIVLMVEKTPDGL